MDSDLDDLRVMSLLAVVLDKRIPLRLELKDGSEVLFGRVPFGVLCEEAELGPLRTGAVIDRLVRRSLVTRDILDRADGYRDLVTPLAPLKEALEEAERRQVEKNPPDRVAQITEWFRRNKLWAWLIALAAAAAVFTSIAANVATVLAAWRGP